MDTAHMELVQTALERIFTDGESETKRFEAAPGQVLYAPDDPQDNVFLLHTGQVRVFHVRDRGHERLVCILGSGSVFGYGAIAGMERLDFRAVTVERSDISRMGVDAFFARLAGNPEAVREVISAMVHHLINAHEDLQQITHDDCNQRLLHKLVGLSESPAAEACAEGVILRITHEELAHHIGMARETVSLALTQLRNKSLLRTGRNQLIYNPRALEAFVRVTQQTTANAEGGSGQIVE